MSTRAALAAGTVRSCTATGAWSWLASLAIGPAAPVHLNRDLAAGYAQLAAAPPGTGAGLFAVVASVYAACLLVSGWRRRRGGG